jgi:hypothetical protein
MYQPRRSTAKWLIGLAMIVGTGIDRSTLASGLTGTWSGASASVSLFGQPQSNQGQTANASESQNLTINYAGSPAVNPQQYYNATVYGGVSASAGGDPSHLLQVTATASAPNPGTLGGPTPHDANATASWTGDSVVVTAPSGSSLPDAVRLNFTLTFSVPQGVPYAGVTATYNGTTINDATNGIGTPFSSSSTVDSTTLSPSVNGSSAILQQTFHTELALNKSGVSDPINLSLALSPYVGLVSNTSYSYAGLTGLISLKSITLPDGSSLAASGDTVTFESGLALSAANVVPESPSLIVWGLIVLVAGVTRISRSRSMPRAGE